MLLRSEVGRLLGGSLEVVHSELDRQWKFAVPPLSGDSLRHILRDTGDFNDEALQLCSI